MCYIEFSYLILWISVTSSRPLSHMKQANMAERKWTRKVKASRKVSVSQLSVSEVQLQGSP